MSLNDTMARLAAAQAEHEARPKTKKNRKPEPREPQEPQEPREPQQEPAPQDLEAMWPVPPDMRPIWRAYRKIFAANNALACRTCKHASEGTCKPGAARKQAKKQGLPCYMPIEKMLNQAVKTFDAVLGYVEETAQQKINRQNTEEPWQN